MDHHRWWMNNHKLRSDSWGATEHETLCKVIDKLGRFDGLDLANLAGAEVTFRRLQLIEYFYSDRGPGGAKTNKGVARIRGRRMTSTSSRVPSSRGVIVNSVMSWWPLS